MNWMGISIMIWILSLIHINAHKIPIKQMNRTQTSHKDLFFEPYYMIINLDNHKNLSMLLEINAKDFSFNCYCTQQPCKLPFKELCQPLTSQAIAEGLKEPGWYYQYINEFRTYRSYQPYEDPRKIIENRLSFTTELLKKHGTTQDVTYSEPQATYETKFMNIVYSNSSLITSLDGVMGLGISHIAGSYWKYLNQFKYEQYVLDLTTQQIVTGKTDIGATYDETKLIKANPTIQYNNYLTSRYLQNEEYRFEYGPSFEIHNMTICNIDLFSNYTGYWIAGVTTLYPGLGLPYEFYRMVLEWIETKNMTQTDKLPSIIITIGSDEKEIEIPLEALITWHFNATTCNKIDCKNTAPYHIHLHNLGPMSNVYQDVGAPISPKIMLGYDVIKSIGPLFVDFQKNQVGFYRNASTTKTSLKKCRSSITCEHPLKYYQPMNTCLNPICSFYWFQYYDQDSKVCRVSPGLTITMMFIAFLFGLVELFQFSVCYRKLSRPLSSHTTNAVPAITT